VTPRLSPLPDRFVASVASLHRVAEQLLAPARKPDNEISLRAAPGGFGTPEFEHEGAVHRVRVEGAELVHEVDGAERRAGLGTLAEGATAVADLLPPGPPLDSEPLEIDRAASRALGELYGFGDAVLARLVDAAGREDEATIPRLWPEHFDIAIELGPEARGLRANYGLSPGDADHPEPYLYVGPWTAEVSGALWNGQGFNGAELGYSELLAAEDRSAVAFDFFATRRDALNETRPPTEEET
jgi:hypothetical protein